MDTNSSPTTRRTVIAGAAWSIPAVAAAAAAPLSAASTTPCDPTGVASDYAYSLSVDGSRAFPLDPIYSTNDHYRVAPGAPIPVTTTFTYSGPHPLPVGATIKLAMANDDQRVWAVAPVSVTGAPAGSLSSPVAAGHDALNDDASLTYTTIAPIPAGTVITFVSNASAPTSWPGSATYPLARTMIVGCSGTPVDFRAVPNGWTDTGSTPLWYYHVYSG